MYSNLKRIYTEHSINPKHHITLTAKQVHYIRNVLRIKTNAFLRIFNGRDGEWLAKTIRIDKKTISLLVEKKIRNQDKYAHINLFFCPIKKERLNILVQKCTELDIQNFIPIKSERVNIKNLNISNLQQNAIEAAQQSERLDIPLVENIKKLEDVIKVLSEDQCLIFCDERNFTASHIIETMRKIKNKFSKWSLIIGPEGGFSKSERNNILKFKNVYSVSLGKRILRSDTAVTVALFCMQQFINY